MTARTDPNFANALATMKLSELWSHYAEIFGESTRCPNKKYLIRRITEALADPDPPEPDNDDESNPTEPAPTEGIDPPSETESSPQPPEDDASPDEEAPAAAGVEASETADGERFPADGDEAEPAGLDADDQDDAAEDAPVAAEETAPIAETPLRKLTVPQLRERYVQVVGRPTSSLHRRYLIWKIQQAQQGKIPVGPRPPRRRDGETSDIKILPLRMHNDHVAKLDQARLRLGLASRMDLFRRALHVYLTQQGEHEVAAAFAPAGNDNAAGE